MRVLIGVLSCHTNADLRQACRDTWVKLGAADVRFFLGRPIVDGQSDEIYLDVPDDFMSLTLKTRAMIAYALDQGYDYLFKCDDDTFVHIPRLLASGFQEHEYVGRASNKYAMGGAGYWVSRRTMQAVLATTLGHGDDWAEDKHVGRAAQEAGIRLVNDLRYFSSTTGRRMDFPAPGNDAITAHKCARWRHELLMELNV